MRVLTMTLAALFFALSTPLPARAQAITDVSVSVLGWINGIRAQNGRGALEISAQLTQTAAAHARDMEQRGFFSHIGSDGSSIGQRARRHGFGFCYVSENIGQGQRQIQSVLTAWMNSAPHRKNILNHKAHYFGMVKAPNDIWVMVLGRPGC